MRSTANTIASASSFQPEMLPLHIPLLGSLHTYNAEEVRQVLAASADWAPQVQGRFVKWEIDCKSRLRAVVEFADEALTSHLQQMLPRGRPWRNHFLILGSCASISPDQHAEFLAAVEKAFPIDTSSTFSCPLPLLKLHNVTNTPPAKTCPTAKRNSVKRKASPHKTWAPSTSNVSPMDLVIKAGTDVVTKTIKKVKNARKIRVKRAVNGPMKGD